MNLSPLFNLIWKINALLILVAGVMACGLMAFVGYTIYKDHARHYGDEVVNIAPDVDAEWRLGSFDRVAGTDYLKAAAYSEQSYGVAYGSASKEASAIRNYLFVNATDKSSRWLMPSNSQLFVSDMRLGETMNAPESELSRWVQYEIVKADTDGDGRLTNTDRRAVAFSDVIGQGYTEIISDADSVIGTELRDANTQLVFYNSGGKSFVAEIDLPARRVSVTKELPQIQR